MFVGGVHLKPTTTTSTLIEWVKVVNFAVGTIRVYADAGIGEPARLSPHHPESLRKTRGRQSGRVGLALWGIAVGGGIGVLAGVLNYGVGTAGSEYGSIAGSTGGFGYDDEGHIIGAGHPEYGNIDWTGV